MIEKKISDFVHKFSIENPKLVLKH